jgi:hypothetical protein
MAWKRQQHGGMAHGGSGDAALAASLAQPACWQARKWRRNQWRQPGGGVVAWRKWRIGGSVISKISVISESIEKPAASNSVKSRKHENNGGGNGRNGISEGEWHVGENVASASAKWRRKALA